MIHTKNLYDTHNHSEFSGDSISTVRDSVKMAMEIDLAGITFTDHYEFPDSVTRAKPDFVRQAIFDIEAQQKLIEYYQEKYPNIKILKGIEIGYTQERAAEAIDLLNKYSFDQVILSIHEIDGCDPWKGEFYEGKTYKEAYGRYLEALYEAMYTLKDFDCLGHYDYIARYPDYPETAILYKDFPDILDEIFKYLAYEGKALEINTKTYKEVRGRLPYIDINLFKRYKELGGDLVCLASDSHAANKVGDRLEWAASIAQIAGFKYFTHFDKRKAIVL